MKRQILSRVVRKQKNCVVTDVLLVASVVAVLLQVSAPLQSSTPLSPGPLPIDNPKPATYPKPFFNLPKYASRKDLQLETVVTLAGGGNVQLVYGPDATGGENLKSEMYLGFSKIPTKSCVAQHWVLGVQSQDEDFGTYQTFIRSFWRKGEYLMMVITAPIDPKAKNREEADLKLITSTIHHYSGKSAKK